MNLSTAGGGGGAALQGAQGISQIFGGLAASRQEDDNAALLRKLGLINANEERRFNRALIGSQIAAAGPSGGSGSSLDIILSAAVEGEVTALRTAFGFNQQAFVAEQRGKAAKRSGLIRGAGTILGGFQRTVNAQPATRTPVGIG